jgi:hypothetical protein
MPRLGPDRDKVADLGTECHTAAMRVLRLLLLAWLLDEGWTTVSIKRG